LAAAALSVQRGLLLLVGDLALRLEVADRQLRLLLLQALLERGLEVVDRALQIVDLVGDAGEAVAEVGRLDLVGNGRKAGAEIPGRRRLIVPIGDGGEAGAGTAALEKQQPQPGAPAAGAAPTGTAPPESAPPASAGAGPAPAQYAATISAAAAQYNVPPAILTNLLGAESGFKANAEGPPVASRGGERARWLGQFMPEEARKYGVTDDQSSIGGAAHYLSDLYAQKGSWAGALGAYSNQGPSLSGYAAEKNPYGPALVAAAKTADSGGSAPAPVDVQAVAGITVSSSDGLPVAPPAPGTPPAGGEPGAGGNIGPAGPPGPTSAAPGLFGQIGQDLTSFWQDPTGHVKETLGKDADWLGAVFSGAPATVAAERSATTGELPPFDRTPLAPEAFLSVAAVFSAVALRSASSGLVFAAPGRKPSSESSPLPSALPIPLASRSCVIPFSRSFFSCS
jgi:hypothetical protein